MDNSRDHGTRVTSPKELNAFLDSQLSRIKRKDKVLFEQLRKRFEKLCTNPECGEVLSHDNTNEQFILLTWNWVSTAMNDAVLDFGLLFAWVVIPFHSAACCMYTI
ncbi:MAG: hypothetical protein LUO89_11050 [Methanothrix sp.]|nr:hypothetical protein [Methanothrix sp.]